MNNKNIVLGAMNIDYPYSSLSEKERNLNTYSDIIETYIQKCLVCDMVPILDTAYYYGNTKTEESLGYIFTLGNLSMTPKIATKANPWLNNDFTTGYLGQLSSDGIRRQLNTSLKNLHMDSVDIFYLHCPDNETPVRETLETCDTLWRTEKFTHLGISNHSKIQLEEIIDICFESGYVIPRYYQGMYNLICRRVEEIFPLLDEHCIEFWGYNPLAGGLLTGKYREGGEGGGNRFKNNAIYQNIFWKEPILTELNKVFGDLAVPECTKMSLQWLQKYSNLRSDDKIIMGVSSIKQCQENLAYLFDFDAGYDQVRDLDYTIISDNSPNYFY
jgi:aflatoxin B1 aldehyde reductase